MGSVSETNPGAIDLTAVGTLDWICWARAEDEQDYKSGVTPLITMEIISESDDPDGNPATNFFYDDVTGNTFSWTDGAPTSTASDLDGGIWIPEVPNGFRIMVPAGTNPQTLILYLGVWQADCKLVASLSDASATDYEYTNSYTEEADDGHVREYVIDFQAASDQETLTVEWTVTANHDTEYGGWGNVTLRAAAVTTGFLDLDDSQSMIPQDYQLDQNYPNPFNPNTTINFTLPKNEDVRLTVFDLAGRTVKTLINGTLGQGTHTVTWNARNDLGQIVPSGVYIYKLEAAEFIGARKMIVLK
jgi:hypothetical protein